MNILMTFNVGGLYDPNPKEQVTVEERAIIVHEGVEDIDMPDVEEGDTIVVEPHKPAEDLAIIVSYIFRNMNICMVNNVEYFLNSNLKEQVTFNERATIVDQYIEDVVMVEVEGGTADTEGMTVSLSPVSLVTTLIYITLLS